MSILFKVERGFNTVGTYIKDFDNKLEFTDHVQGALQSGLQALAGTALLAKHPLPRCSTVAAYIEGSRGVNGLLRSINFVVNDIFYGRMFYENKKVAVRGKHHLDDSKFEIKNSTRDVRLPKLKIAENMATSVVRLCSPLVWLHGKVIDLGKHAYRLNAVVAISATAADILSTVNLVKDYANISSPNTDDRKVFVIKFIGKGLTLSACWMENGLLMLVHKTVHPVVLVAGNVLCCISHSYAVISELALAPAVGEFTREPYIYKPQV